MAILQKKIRNRALTETLKPFKINYDFTIHNEVGLKCGVGVIHCEDKEAQHYRENGWDFKTERMHVLEQCERYGFPVMLVLYTSDDVVFWVRMSEVDDRIIFSKKLNEVKP